ncbi:RidA family protein [Agrobacterium sp. NPDC090283]|uniref:RidA family protein n=1 Tax=Agrobacterium sp. NPDC090283 TaxID=3363920 RepID=UPI00383B912E
MNLISRRTHLRLAGFATAAAATGTFPVFGSSLKGTAAHAGESAQMTNTAQMRAVNPAEINIPNISQAMLIESGKLLFLSGHVPLRDDGMIAGPALEDQLHQAFLNLKATLRAAGADFTNVARMTIYVRGLSRDDLSIIRAVRDRHIDHRRPPASALIGVAELYDPNVRVEIDAIAAVP